VAQFGVSVAIQRSVILSGAVLQAQRGSHWEPDLRPIADISVTKVIGRRYLPIVTACWL